MRFLKSTNAIESKVKNNLAPIWYSGLSLLAQRSGLAKAPIIYIGDAGWVLSTIGQYLAQHINPKYVLYPALNWRGLRYSLIHFGSAPSYFDNKAYLQVHPSNTQVVTWYHGQRSNPNPVFSTRLDHAMEASVYASKIIVKCQIGEETLCSEGVEKQKLVRIPEGVDTQLFHPPSEKERARIRFELGIPDTALCIGSFQKDGDGWDEGMSPKWVKGPEIFLQSVQQLSKDFELCILLTGPARGYVKAGLDKIGVPYRHVHVNEYKNMARYYWALDLYLITSRDEGGPMALLESMASGVPVVSTRVGMCADLLKKNDIGLLADVDDVKGLVAGSGKLLQDTSLRRAMAEQALLVTKDYDWSIIVERYNQEVYMPLLSH